MAKIKPKIPYGMKSMYEASLRDIINNSKRTDPQRIVKSQRLHSIYLGIADGGEFEFRTNSETTPGKEWTQKVYWSDVHQYEELYTNGGHVTEKDIQALIKSNIRVTCDDYSFLYWAWARKSWLLNYGLTPETRDPKRNNVKMHGGACFVAGSLVTMADGTRKPIEDIKVGDYVISHKGQPRRVNHIFQRDYSGEMVNMNLNHINIKCTSNHRFLTYGYYKAKFWNKNPEWVEAKDISYRQVITAPKIKRQGDLILNEDIAFLFGLYLAEGNIHKYYRKKDKKIVYSTVEITLGQSEQNIVNKVVEACNRAYNYKPSVSLINRENHKCIQIRINNEEFATLCNEYCGETAKTKRIKFNYLSIQDEARYNMLLGMIVGDGCIRTGSGGYFKSTSRVLVEQFSALASSLGLRNTISYDLETNRGKNKTTESTTYHQCNLFASHIKKYLEEWKPLMNESYDGTKSRPERDTDLDLFIMGNPNIDKYMDNVKVYNIEVEEDNSYVINGIVVHNCKHILSVLDLIDSSDEIQRAMTADLDIWLSDVYGVEPSEELYGDRTQLDSRPMIDVDDTEVTQKDIENTVDDAVQQSVDDIIQFFIDIVDGYADMDYDMVEYYNSLDPEEKNVLRDNILSYIDDQDVDVTDENVLQVLDLIE